MRELCDSEWHINQSHVLLICSRAHSSYVAGWMSDRSFWEVVQRSWPLRWDSCHCCCCCCCSTCFHLLPTQPKKGSDLIHRHASLSFSMIHRLDCARIELSISLNKLSFYKMYVSLELDLHTCVKLGSLSMSQLCFIHIFSTKHPNRFTLVNKQQVLQERTFCQKLM